jgi:microsomal dipeptidase-like Zn-dependent dipeptidase
VGIETVAKLPNLTQGLLDRGYDREATEAIMGGNWLRTFRRFCG